MVTRGLRVYRRPWKTTADIAKRSLAVAGAKEQLCPPAAAQSLVEQNCLSLFSLPFWEKRDRYGSMTSFLSPIGEKVRKVKPFPRESPGLGEKSPSGSSWDHCSIYLFLSQWFPAAFRDYCSLRKVQLRDAQHYFLLFLPSESPLGRRKVYSPFPSSCKPSRDLIVCCYTNNKPGFPAWFVLVIFYFSVRL